MSRTKNKYAKANRIYICPEHFTGNIERKYFRFALKRRLFNKMIYSKEIIVLGRPGRADFLIKRPLGLCAAGWGRIFTTRLTINGVAFSKELLEWGRTFSDFSGKRAGHIYG